MSMQLSELLYQALGSELGIVVETNDPERLRQKLYGLRKEIPGADVLSFIISPLNPADLWIIKQPQETVDAEG